LVEVDDQVIGRMECGGYVGEMESVLANLIYGRRKREYRTDDC
jgi:hypothetical protein